MDDVAVVLGYGGEADAFRVVAPTWERQGEVAFFVGDEWEAADGSGEFF